MQFVMTISCLSSRSCYTVRVEGYSQITGDSLLACIICSHRHLELAMIAVMDEYTAALLWPERQDTAEEITIVISLEFSPFCCYCWIVYICVQIQRTMAMTEQRNTLHSSFQFLQKNDVAGHHLFVFCLLGQRDNWRLCVCFCASKRKK